MELLVVTTIILLFVFLNSFNYFYYASLTSPGAIYLGTVHWPGDYFYYLSQFAQGKNSWFQSFDLYTSDFPHKTWVGWVNVFLGHIFSLFSIKGLAAYQISVVIFALVTLVIGYFIIRKIYPRDKIRRMAALIFYVAGNSFPSIVSGGGKWTWSYYNYWYDNALPFVRLAEVPHQLVAKACVSMIILIFLIMVRRKDEKKVQLGKMVLAVIVVGVLGFITASIDPVMWFFVSGVIIIAFILYGGYTIITGHDYNLRDFYPFILTIPLVIGGIPMGYYLRRLFSQMPYVQLVNWEASQHVRIDLVQFILSMGPVFVLSLVGIIPIIRKWSFAQILTILFPLVSIFIFFSPIPILLRTVNVRFIPAITYLFICLLAVEGVGWIAEVLGRKRRNIITIVLVGIVVIIMIPSYIAQIREKLIPQKTNAYYYIPKEAYLLYIDAAKISNPGDTFVLIWPFNSSFPAIAGRRVYLGHGLLTSDSSKKDKLQSEFFWGEENPKQREQFLQQNKINYVLAYTWTETVKNIAGLVPVVTRGQFVLYRNTLFH